MPRLETRLAQLERYLCPDHDRPGWCCTVTDPPDPDELPPTCPHGGRWLVIQTVPPQVRAELTDDVDAQPRSRAGQRGTPVFSFTIRLDHPDGDEEAGDE